MRDDVLTRLTSRPILSCVRHDSFICVTWLMHKRDMTQYYVWHDSFSAVIHMAVPQGDESCPTYDWMSHVTHMNESCHTYEWVMSHIWMSHVTPSNDSVMCVAWLIQICHMTHSYVWYDSVIFGTRPTLCALISVQIFKYWLTEN